MKKEFNCTAHMNNKTFKLTNLEKAQNHLATCEYNMGIAQTKGSIPQYNIIKRRKTQDVM